MPRRKHIPIIKRCLAARAQLREMGIDAPARARRMSLTVYLETILLPILEMRLGAPLQLDHDPALGLRRIEGDEWVPHQHNYNFLRWRQSAVHLEKTVGRKPGATRTATTKGSDIWLMKKFRKLEGAPRHKQKIPSRPFQKRV